MGMLKALNPAVRLQRRFLSTMLGSDVEELTTVAQHNEPIGSLNVTNAVHYEARNRRG